MEDKKTSEKQMGPVSKKNEWMPQRSMLQALAFLFSHKSQWIMIVAETVQGMSVMATFVLGPAIKLPFKVASGCRCQSDSL
jgi:hypothetical protein